MHSLQIIHKEYINQIINTFVTNNKESFSNLCDRYLDILDWKNLIDLFKNKKELWEMFIHNLLIKNKHLELIDYCININIITPEFIVKESWLSDIDTFKIIFKKYTKYFTFENIRHIRINIDNITKLIILYEPSDVIIEELDKYIKMSRILLDHIKTIS